MNKDLRTDLHFDFLLLCESCTGSLVVVDLCRFPLQITDWWVQWAYLESRQPLPVHSNPAISLPRRDYNDWRSQLV